MEYFFDPEISMMMRELPEGTLALDFSDPITCRSTLETFAGAMKKYCPHLKILEVQRKVLNLQKLFKLLHL